MSASASALATVASTNEAGDSHALTLFSPAKVNLFFRVIRRRNDGFHDIATLMQALDFGDTVTVRFANTDGLVCSDPSLPTDSSNLAMGAVELFRRKAGVSSAFHVTLDKTIPVEAGLGGGSGNAATVLWGLNQLCGRPAETGKLIEWAGEIGSDLAFFLGDGTAYCTGRGEKVRHVAPLLKRDLWIVKPKGISLSTPAVYSNVDVDRLPARDPEQALDAALDGRLDCFNDLEEAAIKLAPPLRQLRQRLLDLGCTTVLLAGSGSSFFCWGNNTPPEIPGTQTFHTRFTNRNPDCWY